MVRKITESCRDSNAQPRRGATKLAPTACRDEKSNHTDVYRTCIPEGEARPSEAACVATRWTVDDRACAQESFSVSGAALAFRALRRRRDHRDVE